MDGKLEYETASGRKKVKFCPCKKDNKDLKFANFKGHEEYGHCHGCDKTFFPPGMEETFSTTNSCVAFNNVGRSKPVDSSQQLLVTSIPYSLVKSNVIPPDNSNLIKWLLDDKRRSSNEVPFTMEQVQQIIKRYYVRGTNVFNGGVAFIYIDINSTVRQIKLMAYSATTGKRIKEPGKILQIGKAIANKAGIENINIVACFFGEHLLKNNNNKDVYIFESEATAIYASIFYPDCICLATGGKNGCSWDSPERFDVLIGRRIMLWPDIDSHDEWVRKAETLRNAGLNVQVNQMIIENAKKLSKNDGVPFEIYREQKYDLRDILIFKDPQNVFKRQESETKQPAFVNLDLTEIQYVVTNEEDTLDLFEVADLPIEKFCTKEFKDWFDALTQPYSKMRLSDDLIIVDLAAFVTGRLHHINAFAGSVDQGNRSLYIDQLKQIRRIVTESVV